jgi:putative membrane-bound dehydrogenase-like protein
MTMDIATHPDGSIYLATRNEILRLQDENDDGKADKVERKLVWMESEGRYPHNGLSGLAFDAKGDLYFGMGENLGAAYTLTGSDGTSATDQGEGGNIWHCKKDGSWLKRIATGFWNPFGVCTDPQGNVFATDNDPDSSPPCRLHHIVDGGDYGYQFRYGRSGLHPFISWNGQRLGTLPMLAGTGESPCDVISYTPQASAAFTGLSDAWHGTLLVASWVDHRIESYRLTPDAGTFKTEQKILCQGGADFRPVAFAVAADGALYVSDWVKRDYELHGKGRVWRIAAKSSRALEPAVAQTPAKNPDADLVERIRRGEPPFLDEAREWLKADKPYIYHAAIERLSREAPLVTELTREALTDPRQKAGLLLAARRGVAREGLPPDLLPPDIDFLLDRSLADSDPQVVLLALHWISDARISVYRFKVEALLQHPSTTPEIFYAAITTLTRLESETAAEKDMIARLKKEILDPKAGSNLRRLALEILPNRDQQLTAAELEPLLGKVVPEMRPWYVHLIGLLRDPKRHALLRLIALDPRENKEARAAALVHLSLEPADISILISMAMQDGELSLRRAALQALQGATLAFEDRAKLKKIEGAELQRLAARVLGEEFHDRARPASFKDIPHWKGHLKTLPGDPDIENGRRVFFSTTLGGCAVCHRKEGLGGIAGPNLTQVGAAATQDYVLESLLMPNLNLAPQWECFNITTTDGQTRTAFQLSERGGNHIYADLGGRQFEVKIEEIVKRDRMPVSIMPEGLVSKLTDEEVRDLVAYLAGKRG